jgi:hypothetical protein
MLIALVLAATATASPAPPSLASLRVIANVRSTPLCSVLRTRVGPAIGALLENDATIDLAPVRFNQMYREALLSPEWGWGQPSAGAFVNLGNLESLVGPLVKNLKQIDDLLADKAFDDPRLAPVKKQLEAAEAQQKAALNVVSGYDATAESWDILNAGHTALAASQPSQRIFTHFDSAAFFGGAQSLRYQGPRSSPGRFDISLAYNPYRPFAQAIIDMRAQAAVAESVAAASIAPLVASCQAP